MTRSTFSLGALASLLLLPADAKATALQGMPAGKVSAFLVGIDDYKGKYPSLRFATSDASNLAGALKAAGATTTVFQPPAGAALKPAIVAALKKAVAAQLPGQTLLVFLAGHGGEKQDSPVFLLPPAAEGGDVGSLPLVGAPDAVAEILGQSKGNVVLIVDACRSSLSRSASASPFPKGFSSRYARGIAAGFVRPEASPKQQRALLFSCSSGEYAYESDALKGGAFTMALVEGIKNGGAVATGGSITSSSLLAHSAASVWYSQRGQQNPSMYGSGTVVLATGRSKPGVGTDAAQVAAAIKAYKSGDFNAAASAFQKAGDGQDATSLAWAGKSYVELGETEKGLGLLKRATTLDPESTQVRLTYCDAILDFLEQPKAAKSDMEGLKPYWELMLAQSVAILKHEPDQREALAFKAYSQIGTAGFMLVSRMVKVYENVISPYEMRQKQTSSLAKGAFLANPRSFADAGKSADAALSAAPSAPLPLAVIALYTWCSTASPAAANAAIRAALAGGFSPDRLAIWLGVSVPFLDKVQGGTDAPGSDVGAAPSGPIEAPTIVSPQKGESVGGTLTARGTGTPGSTLKFAIKYKTKVLGIGAKGTVTSGEVKVGSDGKWTLTEVPLTSVLNLTRPTFTLEVVAVGAEGAAAKPVTVEFKP